MARALVAACACILAAGALAGCGTVGLSEAGSGDATLGKELFTEKCGSCHVLADAGTQGVIGPNLDDAFVQSRADGLGETTIQSVVRGQIAYPVENPTTGTPGMPADLVTGDDAEAVARYVGMVAGRQAPGGGTPGGGETSPGETSPGETTPAETAPKESGGESDGEAIFAENGCGTCHVFSPAGSTGAIGPNLDESQPTLELAMERVRNGAGAMPAYGDRLTPEQIAAVAEYVSQGAGG